MSGGGAAVLKPVPTFGGAEVWNIAGGLGAWNVFLFVGDKIIKYKAYDKIRIYILHIIKNAI